VFLLCASAGRHAISLTLSTRCCAHVHARLYPSSAKADVEAALAKATAEAAHAQEAASAAQEGAKSLEEEIGTLQAKCAALGELEQELKQAREDSEVPALLRFAGCGVCILVGLANGETAGSAPTCCCMRGMIVTQAPWCGMGGMNKDRCRGRRFKRPKPQ
jgi:hypothetical protein